MIAEDEKILKEHRERRLWLSFVLGASWQCSLPGNQSLKLPRRRARRTHDRPLRRQR